MDILTGSLVVFTLVLFAAISPGPDLLITLRNSLGAGRKSGIYTALGIGVGIYVHVFYSIIGLAVIISQSILLFNIIKWAGAAYLLWMGIKALRSSGWKISSEECETKDKAAYRSFVQGFITNALNPKATLFFLALFTQVISPETEVIIQLWYGTICSFVAMMWFSIVAMMLTHRTVRQNLSSVSVWIDRATGAFFIALAARLALSKAA